MLTVVHNDNDGTLAAGDWNGRSWIDEIVRDGAQRMLATALQAKVSDYIDRLVREIDDGVRPVTTINDAERIAQLERQNRKLRRVNTRPQAGRAASFAAEIDRPHH